MNGQPNLQDIQAYNRHAWDQLVERRNGGTIPASSEAIANARRGVWEITLTYSKPVPRTWFPPLEGLEILCLAGAGGQQGPILAAAGAKVTVYDNSPGQLAHDRLVASREGLALETTEGDMANLHAFPDSRFDLIVHPNSCVFVPDVLPVWREAFRVLRAGGALLSGLVNPVWYLFDYLRDGLQVINRIPYSDLDSLSEEDRAWLTSTGEPLEFGHTLHDLIGGQLAAGFVLTGLYEDFMPNSALAERIPTHIVTRALKPSL